MKLLREKDIDFDNLFNSTYKSRPKYFEHNPDYFKKELHKITDVQWEECKSFFNYCCAYCGRAEDKTIRRKTLIKEHVDNFGSNYLDNCVPACFSCNSSKTNKNFETWYRANPNFSEERLQKVYQWLKSR